RGVDARLGLEPQAVLRVQRRELAEVRAIRSGLGVGAVDGVDADQRVELLLLLPLTRLPHDAGDRVTLAQSVLADHRQGHVDVVGPGQGARRADEGGVGEDVRDSGRRDQDIVLGDLRLLDTLAAAPPVAVVTAPVATPAARPAVVIVVVAIVLTIVLTALVALPVVPVVLSVVSVVLSVVAIVLPVVPAAVVTLPVTALSAAVLAVLAAVVGIVAVARVLAVAARVPAVAARVPAVAARVLVLVAGGLAALIGASLLTVRVIGGGDDLVETRLGGRLRTLSAPTLARLRGRCAGSGLSGRRLRCATGRHSRLAGAGVDTRSLVSVVTSGRSMALGRRRAAGLCCLDGLDQLTLAHPASALETQAGGQLLKLGQNHAIEARGTATLALRRRGSFVCRRRRLIVRRLRDAGNLGVSHSGSFPGPAPARLPVHRTPRGCFPEGIQLDAAVRSVTSVPAQA